jgi:hypothetical protein
MSQLQKIKKVKNSDFLDIFWIHGYRQNFSFFETQAFRTSSIHFLDQNLTLITNLASEFSKISQKLDKNRCFRLKTRALPTRGYPHMGWATPTRFRLKVPLPTWVSAWDWSLESHSFWDWVGNFIVYFLTKTPGRAWKRCLFSIRCTKLLDEVCNPDISGKKHNWRKNIRWFGENNANFPRDPKIRQSPTPRVGLFNIF